MDTHTPPADHPHSPSVDSDQPVTLTLLADGSHTLGLNLTPDQLAQFARYYHELVTWNTKINLTSIVDAEGVQVKHFLDCLAGIPVLAAEWKNPPLALRSARCLDVGTGAGFPGVPLKIALPHLDWTLLDGTGKKISFLRSLVTQLGLTGVAVVQGRAEELGRQDAFREQFDLVTARAVAPLNSLVEYLLPLVRQDGLTLVYKGASAAEEFIEARRAIEVLGGETVRLAPIQVPFLAEKRFLLLIKKVRPTPKLYPRGQGLSRKKPIQ
ncbi:MAG TPA: 16S rRNA (guanine(527)-N(7))-methyltransferase RsmG [Caldilineaceae bacterium]|nr:16S rRNA (guanine(527)-N(7))-methyltransferase RsmG [Caldilineaceae bacterium]